MRLRLAWLGCRSQLRNACSLDCAIRPSTGSNISIRSMENWRRTLLNAITREPCKTLDFIGVLGGSIVSRDDNYIFDSNASNSQHFYIALYLSSVFILLQYSSHFLRRNTAGNMKW